MNGLALGLLLLLLDLLLVLAGVFAMRGAEGYQPTALGIAAVIAGGVAGFAGIVLILRDWQRRRVRR